MELKIDYLAITGGQALIDFVKSLGPTKETKGLLGYPCGLVSDLSGVSVYFGGSAEMGVHLRLSGEGCDNLRDNLAEVLRMGRASRLDLALDGVPISVSQFAKLHQSGLTRGLSQRYTMMTSNHGESDSTYYVGSRQSEKFIRVYTKNRETTRIEIEAKGALAHALQTVINNGNSLNDAFVSVFKVLSKRGANSHQDKIASWFQKIGKATCITACVFRCTMDSTLKWLERSVSRTLAMVEESIPGYVQELLNLGLKKWNSQSTFLAYG